VGEHLPSKPKHCVQRQYHKKKKERKKEQKKEIKGDTNKYKNISSSWIGRLILFRCEYYLK
jgi:hypothetical protein